MCTMHCGRACSDFYYVRNKTADVASRDLPIVSQHDVSEYTRKTWKNEEKPFRNVQYMEIIHAEVITIREMRLLVMYKKMQPRPIKGEYWEHKLSSQLNFPIKLLSYFFILIFLFSIFYLLALFFFSNIKRLDFFLDRIRLSFN